VSASQTRTTMSSMDEVGGGGGIQSHDSDALPRVMCRESLPSNSDRNSIELDHERWGIN